LLSGFCGGPPTGTRPPIMPITELQTPATRAARARTAKVFFACVLIAFLIAGFFSIRNLASWPARLRYPGAEMYEGVPLAEMVRLRQGDPIYAGGAEKSFADATYGPLYYLLGSHLVNPRHPSYVPLRLLSMLGILGCAAGCALLAFWLSQSYFAAALAPLIFISYGMTTSYGVSALSDAVALFFFFAGLLVAYRFRYGRAILLSVPLMLLGFYYKPQYVAGPLAVFAFLLLEKQYRRATEFAGLLALGGLGVLAFFQWIIFPGQAFWRHFFMYQTSLLTWLRFGQGLFIFACMLVIPLLLVANFLYEYPNKLLTCYFASAVGLGLFTFSKPGSGTHYFFECVLLISAVVPALLANQFTKRAEAAYVVVLLAVGLWAGQWLSMATPKPADFTAYRTMRSYLRGSFPRSSMALCFEPGILVQSGLRAPFSGLFTLVQLAHRGMVSDRGLVAQIQGRRFSAIMLIINPRQERDPYWLNFSLTRSMREAIESNYRLARTMTMPAPERPGRRDRFYVYVPKGR
jgi:hypothetical protein